MTAPDASPGPAKASSWLFPDPGLPPTRRGREAAPGGGAMLDPPTHCSDTVSTGNVCWFPRRSVRQGTVWSRVYLGMALPGRYYWLTLTSSAVSPPIKRTWPALLRWLHHHASGAELIRVLTDEGFGVAHVVVRLKRTQKNIDVRALRSWWQVHHKATQIKIVPVRLKRDALIRYISEQSKKGLSSEMAGQVHVTSFGRTRRWLPVGFLTVFSRFWFCNASKGIPSNVLSLIVADWCRVCHQAGSIVEPPTVTWAPETTSEGQASLPTSESPTAPEDCLPSPSGVRSKAGPTGAAGMDERGPQRPARCLVSPG